MKIKTQDGDRSYNITKVYYIAHSCGKIFMGWNIYGTNGKGRKYLLGTCDTDIEADQITKEINRLMAKGVDKYSVPALVEDYEAEDLIARLEARLNEGNNI